MLISTFDSPRTGVLSPLAGQENPPANLPRPRVVPWWLVGCCCRPRRGRIQASGEWTSRFTFAGASSAIIDKQLLPVAVRLPRRIAKRRGDLILAIFQNIMKISRQSHSCGQTATNRHPTSRAQSRNDDYCLRRIRTENSV